MDASSVVRMGIPPSEERVSELEEENKLLRKSLEEKELLLREAHHRIKNNLQIVSSMLSMHLNGEPANEERERLFESQSRIRAAALIHETLCISNDFSSVDFAEYSRRLATQVIGAASQKKEIALKIDMKNIALDMEKAMCCGLIINELLLNALQHGLEKRKKGAITIKMRALNDAYMLSVANNGERPPEGFSVESAASTGAVILRALAEQLNGRISFSRNGKTEFTVEFPKNGA